MSMPGGDGGPAFATESHLEKLEGIPSRNIKGLVIPTGEGLREQGLWGVVELDLPDKTGRYWVCSLEVEYDWGGLHWRQKLEVGYAVEVLASEDDLSHYEPGTSWFYEKCRS